MRVMSSSALVIVLAAACQGCSSGDDCAALRAEVEKSRRQLEAATAELAAVREEVEASRAALEKRERENPAGEPATMP